MTNNFETRFDAWSDPVLLVDPRGFVRHANEAACTAFGYSEKELDELPLRTLIPGEDAEQRAWMRAMYVRDRQGPEGPTGADLACMRKDGRTFAAHVTFETASVYRENWTWVRLTVRTNEAGTELD